MTAPDDVPLDQEVLVDIEASDEITATSSAETPPKRAEARKEGVDENSLQKQLDDLRKAEGLIKQQLADERARADLATRNARQRELELTQARGDREQAQYDHMLAEISSANTEADKAQGDLEAALAAGDYKVAAEAQRRLTNATAVMVDLEGRKGTFETRREEAKAREPQPQQRDNAGSVDAAIDAMPQLSPRQRDWLKAHKEAVTDPRKNARLGAAHWDALEAGHATDTDAYFQFLEEKTGFRQPAPKEEREEEPAPAPQRRSLPVSAPVSRESPNLGTGRSTPTKVKLSPEQREHARIAGVDETTYAKGVLELERRKSQGMYPDR